MAFAFTNVVSNSIIKTLENKLLTLSLKSCSVVPIREKSHLNPKPRLRNPTWLTRKNRVIHEDFVTSENREFLKEVVHDLYETPSENPLEKQLSLNTIEWTPDMKRTGVIARKIGNVPMWLKNGKKVHTTMLQILDNHVIKYYPPDAYNSPRKPLLPIKKKKGCLLLGAEATDPTLLTKEYCGIFKNSGVMPKKHLARFFVSPDAIIPPGTPITALHFTVGNRVDVRGKTIDRGFQGVMKRHGFKGMPASHGVTKTHRRGGNIGGGGEKGRVWPGTKMPGHMGNRFRIHKGCKIYRINTRYNVLWVSGGGIPGETNAIVHVYDTILPLRKPAGPLPFPTYLSKEGDNVSENIYDDSVHNFSDPTIVFDEK